MGIIADLELVFNVIGEVMPLLDALPLSPELAVIRAKIESALAALKATGL